MTSEVGADMPFDLVASVHRNTLGLSGARVSGAGPPRLPPTSKQMPDGPGEQPRDDRAFRLSASGYWSGISKTRCGNSSEISSELAERENPHPYGRSRTSVLQPGHHVVTRGPFLVMGY